MIDKKVLREVYLDKRLTLTTNEYKQRNEQLLNILLSNLNLENFKFAHFFLPIEKNKEVNTGAIMDALKERYGLLNFVVSKTLPKRQLAHYIYDSETELEVSSWGIPEPKTGRKILEAELDVIFVPLIVCDKKGYRIGYGGGYYDIFLSKAPKAKKVGLSLAPLLDEILYIEDFDVKLDACITPFEFHSFTP